MAMGFTLHDDDDGDDDDDEDEDDDDDDDDDDADDDRDGDGDTDGYLPLITFSINPPQVNYQWLAFIDWLVSD